MATANTKSLFTYATDKELIAAELKALSGGEQGAYNVVRIVRKTEDEYGTIEIDFPSKTLESFERDMAVYSGEIIDLYPAVHYHPEPEDY